MSTRMDLHAPAISRAKVLIKKGPRFMRVWINGQELGYVTDVGLSTDTDIMPLYRMRLTLLTDDVTMTGIDPSENQP